MGIPIAIFAVCLVGGVYASTRWLPELGRDAVGGLALFVVCGLFGASLADAGLRIYGIIHAVETSSGSIRGDFVASGLSNMLWEAGSLAALALVVYLLAPASEPLADDTSPG
jgi:hypothetical protein